ncbi:gentisate 1,2-dioxygenase [Parasphingopyxis sp.]|uniref:gentisate 1,2-dioxygenase n=1 Tax=Parasphingopyxis sp. TaxID=1920299 RepID=UPI002630CE86|nr:gentisate 1,2-dioxygenase [Parasphingopyxis sp.]
MVKPEEFRAALSEKSMRPLWDVMSNIVLPEPAPVAIPAIWEFSDVAPLLEEAGRLISAEEAERRVLVLENPAMQGEVRIVDSLYAGMQLILPGETAPAHRHSQSALRFVVEGEGAFTSVDGERAIMKPGDFIVTANWRWHDHGNETDAPMIWLDGLDIPIVDAFKATFAQRHTEMRQETSRPSGYSEWRHGSGLSPVDEQWDDLSSPQFHYPFARVREALTGLADSGAPDPCHGYRMRYTNPSTGGWAMPTIAAYMTYFQSGFSSKPYRSTESRVCIAVEGEGKVCLGGQSFVWGPKDVFAIPAWTEFLMEAETDAFVFSFSDRAAQEKLGFFRQVAENREVGVS